MSGPSAWEDDDGAPLMAEERGDAEPPAPSTTPWGDASDFRSFVASNPCLRVIGPVFDVLLPIFVFYGMYFGTIACSRARKYPGSPTRDATRIQPDGVLTRVPYCYLTYTRRCVVPIE